MKQINRILVFFIMLLGNVLVFANEVMPPAPVGRPGTGQGGGGVGPGVRPASPIDLYVYVLAIVAMLFIVYYARRTSTIKTD